jgi:replicative DNA helicase
MELIRHLVRHDADPDPVTVLHAARRRGPADERSGRPVSARRHHRLAAHLADLYTNALSPVLVRQYAREVLEDAFRRAAGAHGACLNQLAENGADRVDLAQCVSAMRAELAELWRRIEAAPKRPSTASQ